MTRDEARKMRRLYRAMRFWECRDVARAETLFQMSQEMGQERADVLAASNAAAWRADAAADLADCEAAYRADYPDYFAARDKENR